MGSCWVALISKVLLIPAHIQMLLAATGGMSECWRFFSRDSCLRVNELRELIEARLSSRFHLSPHPL